MGVIKTAKSLLACGIVVLCTLSCSAEIQDPTPDSKSDRSDPGVTQYMGYPGQGYGLGYGGADYAGAYPAPPVAGLVPPYANGGGYLGSPPYTGYYPPYGELYPPQSQYPVMPPPMYPSPVVPGYPGISGIPGISGYPGYPYMRPGMGYSQYSARKRMDTNGLA